MDGKNLVETYNTHLDSSVSSRFKLRRRTILVTTSLAHVDTMLEPKVGTTMQPERDQMARDMN